MLEALAVAEPIPAERSSVEVQEGEELLQRAQQLRMEVQRGHGERFPELERAVDALTQLSWFTRGERSEECRQLYETTSAWKKTYFHLYLADKCCEALRATQEGDDHHLWGELQRHLSELAPLQPSFAPDMEERYQGLCTTAHKWKEINDRLYYGGEAMAIIRQGFSPPAIRNLMGQVRALRESNLLYAAYPLQIQRAQALTRFWIEKVQMVFDHASIGPVSHSQDNTPLPSEASDQHTSGL
jgi:hypothetical protein